MCAVNAASAMATAKNSANAWEESAASLGKLVANRSAPKTASTFAMSVTSVTAIAKNIASALKDIAAKPVSGNAGSAANICAMNAASVILTAKNSASALNGTTVSRLVQAAHFRTDQLFRL